MTLLQSTGHNVVGHSTRGGDELIAGDLADPGCAARDLGAALDRLGGRIDVLVNNAGIYEGVADDASDEEWHAAWARTLTINLQAPADLSRLAVAHFLDAAAAGGSSTSPAAPPIAAISPQHWHYAASKAAMIGMTKTIARGYAAEGILAFAVAPGLHRVGNDRGISRRPRRRADRRRHPARPGRQHRRSRRGDPLAGDRRARLRDRHRRSTSTARAMFASLRYRRGARRGSLRAERSSAMRRQSRPAPARTAWSDARAAGPNPRQRL